MFQRRRLFETCVLALLALSCGRPTVQEDRKSLVVTFAGEVQSKERLVRVSAHAKDCPTEQWTFEASPEHGTGQCLSKLVAGQSVDHVKRRIKFPLMACGKPSGPTKDTIGDCVSQAISIQQVTPCTK